MPDAAYGNGFHLGNVFIVELVGGAFVGPLRATQLIEHEIGYIDKMGKPVRLETKYNRVEKLL